MDWQELPAGKTLNRYVARKRGWRIKRIVAGRKELVRLQAPDDTLFDAVATEDLAWRQAPAYSTRIAAALTLVDDTNWFTLEQLPAEKREHGRWQATFYQRERQTAETPALAVVRAWLAWQEYLTGMGD